MTAELSSIAVQNAPLLRALKEGGHASATALAEAAGVIRNNINRQLVVCEAEGLIWREDGAPTHEAQLTLVGEAALAILAIRMVPFDQIDAWDGNPRTQFNPADDEAMARSIGDKGILQPLILRPKGERYEVIIGERRRRAAVLAVQQGWQPPDFLVKAEIRELTDDDALVIAGVENLQREDMHWMDEANWYLRLAARMSGPQIERLVGGQRKKRSIQDYIKCARELSPQDIGRTYLPEKIIDPRTSKEVRNPDCLLYAEARDLVGEKKEKPALDLPDKLKLAFAEMLVKADYSLLDGGRKPHCPLHKPPMGGPIIALQERKLIAARFEGQNIVCDLATDREDVQAWLQQIGYFDDPQAALHKVRAAALGELHAGTFREGEFHTEELNAPPPAPALAPAPQEPGPTIAPSARRELREIGARSIHRHRLLDGWVHAQVEALQDQDYLALYDLQFVLHREKHDGLEIAVTLAGKAWLKSEGIAPEDGKSANSCTTPWLRTDAPAGADDDQDEPQDGDEPPAAGEPVQASSPPAAPAAPVFSLPPILAIVALELAHKIANGGLERGPGTWAAPVRASYYKDNRVNQLGPTHRALAVFPINRDDTVAALTSRCLDWLCAEYDLTAVGDGRVIFDDELLTALHEKLGFTPEPDGPYATWWLNPVPTSEAPEAPAPAPAVAPQPAPASFSDHMRQMGAEARIARMQRQEAALREAAHWLRTAVSRKLKSEEADKICGLIETALEAGEGA